MLAMYGALALARNAAAGQPAAGQPAVGHVIYSWQLDMMRGPYCEQCIDTVLEDNDHLDLDTEAYTYDAYADLDYRDTCRRCRAAVAHLE